MKRLFVAINTSNLFGPAFQPFLKKLKIGADQKEIAMRWTQPENYHVTLSFLGERPAGDIPRIFRALEEAVQISNPFALKMEDVSAFPSETNGRVIYVGVQSKRSLHQLKSTIDLKLVEHGLIKPSEIETEYSPHLTIGRLRNSQHVKDFLSPVKRKSFGKIEVNQVVLYESFLQGYFPKYIQIGSFHLSPTEQSFSHLY